MSKFYYLFLVFGLLGCNEVSVDSDIEKLSDTHFSEFVSRIPAYSFPIEMNCNFDVPAIDKDFIEFTNFFPEGGRVVSKLESNNNFSLIIFDFACDYSCPILYSYNINGKPLDSLPLTPGQCGEDQFISSNEWFTINKEIEIELIDTTTFYSDSLDFRMLDSVKIEVQKFELNDNGMFVLI